MVVATDEIFKLYIRQIEVGRILTTSHVHIGECRTVIADAVKGNLVVSSTNIQCCIIGIHQEPHGILRAFDGDVGSRNDAQGMSLVPSQTGSQFLVTTYLNGCICISGNSSSPCVSQCLVLCITNLGGLWCRSCCRSHQRRTVSFCVGGIIAQVGTLVIAIEQIIVGQQQREGTIRSGISLNGSKCFPLNSPCSLGRITLSDFGTCYQGSAGGALSSTRSNTYSRSHYRY